jgi:hypothetical protein
MRVKGASLRLTYGADGDGYAGGGVGGSQHVTASIEDSAGIDDHAGRVHFASHNTLCLNLDAAFGENDAVKAARDDHAIAFDLSLDFCAFAQDDRLFGDDVAFDVAVDAKRSGQLQGTFEGHALINEAGPLFVRTVLGNTGPLPRHGIPRTMTLPL